MAKKEKRVPVYIAFDSIEILDFTLKRVSKNPFETTEPSFEVKIDAKVSRAKGQVINVVEISILDKVETYVKISVSIAFNIKDFENVVKIQDNGLSLVPESIYGAINIPSVETVRGILWSELRGTKYDKIIIPLLHDNKLAEVKK
jgi:hypothetical protein